MIERINTKNKKTMREQNQINQIKKVYRIVNRYTQTKSIGKRGTFSFTKMPKLSFAFGRF
jgi:hypothetical protein